MTNKCCYDYISNNHINYHVFLKEWTKHIKWAVESSFLPPPSSSSYSSSSSSSCSSSSSSSFFFFKQASSNLHDFHNGFEQNSSIFHWAAHRIFTDGRCVDVHVCIMGFNCECFSKKGFINWNIAFVTRFLTIDKVLREYIPRHVQIWANTKHIGVLYTAKRHCSLDIVMNCKTICSL